jgi:hypothetical protein
MKKKEKKYEIVTISKEKFDKLSPAKQRMTIAQDVIDRIKIGQITPSTGRTLHKFNIQRSPNYSVKKLLAQPIFNCQACALGAMFMANVGINNNCNVNTTQHITASSSILKRAVNNDLSDIFSVKQMALIEIAFEQTVSIANGSVIHSKHDLDRSIKFCGEGHKRLNDKDKLLKICNNIIKNQGAFKP